MSDDPSHRDADHNPRSVGMKAASIAWGIALATWGLTVAVAEDSGSNGWPAHAREDLPMAGVFFGHHLMGEDTGNGILFRHAASRRFRAERTGAITAVRHNNRTLLQANIADRCRDGNVWCRCKDNDLDRYTCGYILANSYSVGNGGLIAIEIQSDDGSDHHLPSGEVLASVAQQYVPLRIAEQVYPVLELAAPAVLQAGRIYHVVYHQLNPPSDCPVGAGYSVSEAAHCDRTKGMVGLNGISFNATTDRGPWLGRTAAVLTKQSSDDPWVLDPDNLSWLEVRYDDGTWTGDAYTYNDGASTARSIEGQHLVRQVFTVTDKARDVDGIWLRAGRAPDSGTGTLSCVIRGSEGTAAMASFAASSFPVCGGVCGEWAYSGLSAPLTLLPGQTYSVEFSAQQKGHFLVTTGFPLAYAPYSSESRNTWEDARAEYSNDNGRTWLPFTGTYHPERDLSVLFTVVGMPRSLP